MDAQLEAGVWPPVSQPLTQDPREGSDVEFPGG
jgi:hypothetical protein